MHIYKGEVFILDIIKRIFIAFPSYGFGYYQIHFLSPFRTTDLDIIRPIFIAPRSCGFGYTKSIFYHIYALRICILSNPFFMAFLPTDLDIIKPIFLSHLLHTESNLKHSALEKECSVPLNQLAQSNDWL